MPSPKNDRKIGVPLLNRFSNFHGLANHGPCDQGNAQAEGILDFVHDAFLVVGRNRSIDNADFVSGFQKGSRDRQDAKRGSGLNAGEGCDEEYNFFRRFHGNAFRRVTAHKSNSKVRSKGTNRWLAICLRIVKTLQNPTERKPLSQISFQALSHDESVTTLRSASISDLFRLQQLNKSMPRSRARIPSVE